jgi:hypothetical protein
MPAFGGVFNFLGKILFVYSLQVQKLDITLKKCRKVKDFKHFKFVFSYNQTR